MGLRGSEADVIQLIAFFVDYAAYVNHNRAFKSGGGLALRERRMRSTLKSLSPQQLAFVGLAMIAFGAVSANGATITVTSQASVDSPDYDLTNVYGLGDWAYWENNAGDGGSPLNRKSGASLIGDITVVGGGTLSGTTSTNRTVQDFVFSDGTNGALTSPKIDVIGLFSNAFNTVGAGVELDVVSPVADPFNIYLWGAGFRVDEGTLEATIGGASDSDTTLNQGSTRSPGILYTIAVDPDFIGQPVNLNLSMTDDGTGDFSHVSIAGVAVDTARAVPEPASVAIWSILGLGLACFGYYRARRKK